MGTGLRRASAVLVAVATLVLVPASMAAASPDQIGVCCAWGNGITNGITYSISAPDDLVGPMTAAVEAWETATGINLVNAGPGAKKSDVEVSINYKSGGGQVAGQTIRRYEPRSVFIQGANVTISGGAYGHGPFGVQYDADTVAMITLHEFGHVLGAGHADAPGYVMSPEVGQMVEALTSCDIAAVEVAQDWFLNDPAGGPADPTASSVSCT